MTVRRRLTLVGVVLVTALALGAWYIERARAFEEALTFTRTRVGLVAGDLEMVFVSERASDKNLQRALHMFRTLRVPQRLHLNHCTLSAETLQALSELKWLEGLLLAHSSIDDEGLTAIRDFRSLESLGLAWTSVSDAALPTLATLRSLEELHIGRTLITPGKLREMRSAWPKLDVDKVIRDLEKREPIPPGAMTALEPSPLAAETADVTFLGR